jgi:hypothetical protein
MLRFQALRWDTAQLLAHRFAMQLHVNKLELLCICQNFEHDHAFRAQSANTLSSNNSHRNEHHLFFVQNKPASSLQATGNARASSGVEWSHRVTSEEVTWCGMK